MKEIKHPMSGIEQATEILMTKWGAKTLEALRCEAEAEPSGVMFESLRIAAGQRLMIVVCVTGKSQIASLRRMFDFADTGVSADWAKLTLLETVMRAKAGPGYAFEGLKNEAGEFSHIVLTSAEPRSMAMIERVFEMPK